MGEVPDGQRAAFVGQGGQAGHVVLIAGLVVDVGDHHHGRVRADGFGKLLRALHQAQRIALLEHVRQAFGHVEVGGEVARLGDDHLARGVALGLDAQRRHQHLEQVDRGGVGDHHFILVGPYQPRQLVAQALGQGAPACAVPAADQAVAPLLLDHFTGTFQRRDRACAQGVAIQVDHPLGQGEIRTQMGKGVLGVERQAMGFCCHGLS
ncbi:hypothetical protein D3C84_596550 [compost metagenome]